MAERSIHGQPGMVFIGYDVDGECLWDYPNGDNMAKPLDEDFNYNFTGASNPITTGGISIVQPKQVKGGVFAPADMDLIKRALYVYKDKLVADATSERDIDPELSQLANLLHRVTNRI
jgi:hypothetical protein